MPSSSHHQHTQQSPTFTLSQLKMANLDTLLKPAGKRVSDDWETGVKALETIPGYTYSASMSLRMSCTA